MASGTFIDNAHASICTSGANSMQFKRSTVFCLCARCKTSHYNVTKLSEYAVNTAELSLRDNFRRKLYAEAVITAVCTTL